MYMFAPPIERSEEEIDAIVEDIYNMNRKAKRLFNVNSGYCTGISSIEFDETEVKSAIKAVLCSYYVPIFGQFNTSDCVEQSACIAYYLSKNHVFADGNKRTSLVALVSLLDYAGYRLVPPGDTLDERQKQVYSAIQRTFAPDENDSVLRDSFVSWVKSVTITK